MFNLLKSLFAAKESPDVPPDDLWNVMEKMDSRNSLARLKQLNLNSQQYAVVKGLLEGSLSPSEQPGVADWCHMQEVSEAGMSALGRALQITLLSDGITYVFAGKRLVAEIPKLTTSGDLTIVLDHMGGTPAVIASLDEILESHGIADYSLGVLTPSELRRRATGKPDFARDPLDRGVSPSVTLEMRVDDQQQLLEPFEVTELVDAINRELGYDLTPDKLTFVGGPIDQLGLFDCIAQINSIKQKKIMFWLVPKVEADSATEC